MKQAVRILVLYHETSCSRLCDYISDCCMTQTALCNDILFAEKSQQTWEINPLKPFNLHPLQVENCCRNSRLVVDEDELKWVKN